MNTPGLTESEIGYLRGLCSQPEWERLIVTSEFIEAALTGEGSLAATAGVMTTQLGRTIALPEDPCQMKFL